MKIYSAVLLTLALASCASAGTHVVQAREGSVPVVAAAAPQPPPATSSGPGVGGASQGDDRTQFEIALDLPIDEGAKVGVILERAEWLTVACMAQHGFVYQPELSAAATAANQQAATSSKDSSFTTSAAACQRAARSTAAPGNFFGPELMDLSVKEHSSPEALSAITQYRQCVEASGVSMSVPDGVDAAGAAVANAASDAVAKQCADGSGWAREDRAAWKRAYASFYSAHPDEISRYQTQVMDVVAQIKAVHS